MIITCPICRIKFNLDDERIPEGKAKVRCSKCQHVFQVQKSS
ncbi:MAG: zinc-ribbon domain-containing protein, partial [Deltaproteobacteria bacterium]|nr:zinc-ribbon domain-containing protein [Deltaproteobacteria bacterium]